MDASPEPEDLDRQLDLHLVEYNNLKSDQASRIRFRHILLYVSLGVGALRGARGTRILGLTALEG